MKIKSFIAFVFILFVSSNIITAKNNWKKSAVNYPEISTMYPLPVTSLTYTPLSEKYKIKPGFAFPFSWGVGLQGFAYSQQYDTKELFIHNNKISAHSDSLAYNITAGEYQLFIRPEIWVLPYLNVYGIFGYVEGNITPDITVHGIVVEWPVFDTVYDIYIDTSIVVSDPMKYNGPVYGIGATASYVFHSFFVELDYNYSVVFPKDMDGKLKSHRISPKAGWMFSSVKSKIEGAAWLGASWLENTQTLTGVVNVRDFAGDLADLLGEEADYVATLTPVNKWNMVIGGSLTLNKHYNLACEVGLIGRKKLSLGFVYRFW